MNAVLKLFTLFWPSTLTFDQELQRAGFSILNRRGIEQYRAHELKIERSFAHGFWRRHIALACAVRSLFFVVTWQNRFLISPEAKRRIVAALLIIPSACLWSMARYSGIAISLVLFALYCIEQYLGYLQKLGAIWNFVAASAHWTTVSVAEAEKIFSVPEPVRSAIAAAQKIPGARVGVDVIQLDPLVWVKPRGFFRARRYITYFDAPGIERFLHLA